MHPNACALLSAGRGTMLSIWADSSALLSEAGYICMQTQAEG